MENVIKNKWYIGGAVIVLVLLFGIYKFKNQEVIETKKVEIGEMIDATYAVGTVKADKVFNLKTGVNTKMVERYVRVGDHVKKGQKLVSLDSFPLYTAPFEGVITVLNYEVGELVFAQSTVLTLVNNDLLYLELTLDEKSVNKIKTGDEAEVTFDRQTKVAKGKVRAIFSNSDTFYVHVDFDQKDLVLLPGMTADVSIITKRYPKALLVPLAAISPRNTVKDVAKNSPVKTLTILHKDSKYAAISNTDITVGEELEVNKETSAGKKNNTSGGGH